MKHSPRNTDGIFVRRRSQQAPHRASHDQTKIPSHYLADPHKSDKSVQLPAPQVDGKDLPPTFIRRGNQQAYAMQKQAPSDADIDKKTLDFDLSLDDEQNKNSRKKSPKKRGFLWGWRPTKKFFKRAAIVLVLLVLLTGGYFGYKLFVATNNVFKGGGKSALGGNGIDLSKLQHEGDGRINILLAATSEDDPAHINAGAKLTDSIMIASIDPVNKGATLVSIPRDLWVKMPGCTLYYQEKINAAYQCGEQIGFKESGYPNGGMGYLQKIVENTSGVHINYYAKINYTAFRQAVDAVGGIDIKIESPDPRGILDRNFDWICRYQCTKVKWPNGVAHLDGEHALYLARSRNDPGKYLGYGLPRGDFDRTNNQRKMLIALKEKASSLATLSNPVKVSNLIDSIGNNLVTNFSRDDILSLSKVAKDIPADKIKSVGLADGADAVLTTGNVNGASVVKPKAGTFAYEPMQLYIRSQIIDPYIIKESPTIALYNGTATAGLAAKQKDVLASYGYNVVIVGDSSAKDSVGTNFYDTTKGKKAVTKQYLQNRYSTTTKTGALPEGIDGQYEVPGTAKTDENGQPVPAQKKTADFVIILGSSAQ